MKKVLVLLLTLVMIVGITACGGKTDKTTTDKWPTTGLGALVPAPGEGTIELIANDSSWFEVNVYGVSSSLYEAYVKKCISAGFDIEITNDGCFKAFNEDGVSVAVDYRDYEEPYMSIDVEAAIEMKALRWPAGKLGAAVPKPDSEVGKNEYEDAESFSLYVGDTTTDKFNEYIDKCINAGFDIEYSRGDTGFYALNADGISMSVTYEGFNIMYINVSVEEPIETEEPKATDTPAPTAEPTAAPTEAPKPTKAPASSGNKELRDFLKSYEAFIDEYCAFMKKYKNSDDVLGMLNDYTSYLNKYTDFCDKAAKWESKNLSAEDLKEYTEVMLRCSKKIAEIY